MQSIATCATVKATIERENEFNVNRTSFGDMIDEFEESLTVCSLQQSLKRVILILGNLIFSADKREYEGVIVAAHRHY